MKKKEKKKKQNKIFDYLKSFNDDTIYEEYDDENNVKEIIVEKNDGFNIIEVLIIILVAVFFGVVVGYRLAFNHSSGVEVSKEVQEIVTTYNNIIENYYGEVSEKELLDAAVSGMINKLDDPYSLFMSGDSADEFNESVDGSFVGIGVVVEAKDNKFRITEIIKNSPAEKAKLLVDDYIIKVSNENVEGMTLAELSKKMKNSNKKNVELTILRKGKEKKFNVKKDVVEVSSVKGYILDNKIGLIKVDKFALNTSDQFKSELERLEKSHIKSLIIDLRNNPGGRLGEIQEIMDLFLEKKKIVYQISSKNDKTSVYTEDSKKRSYPICILVNYNSASAAEILAVSFQDNYKKSVVVGTQTYGKGTIQKAVSLSSGSTIKYTTQKWLSPKGKWLNEIGVIPDILIENRNEFIFGGEEDLQLKKAIELLTK